MKLLKLIYEKTTMKADDLIFNNQCEKNVYNEYQLLGEMTNLILSIFRASINSRSNQSFFIYYFSVEFVPN